MVQCPQCFSWINDSVTDVCPNCGEMVFPPMKRATPPSDRPVIPAFGQSVRCMIAGIVAAYLAGFSHLMTVPLWDRSVAVEAFISNAAFVFVLWLPAVILGGVALRGALLALRMGNRTRMAKVGRLLGVLTLILGGVILLTVIALCVRYAA